MSLQDEVLAAWTGRLSKHGFRKTRGLNTMPLGQDWLGVVGLNSQHITALVRSMCCLWWRCAGSFLGQYSSI